MDKIIRKRETKIRYESPEVQAICAEFGLDADLVISRGAWEATIGKGDEAAAIQRIRDLVDGFMNRQARIDEHRRVDFTVGSVSLRGFLDRGDERDELTITLNKRA